MKSATPFKNLSSAFLATLLSATMILSSCVQATGSRGKGTSSSNNLSNGSSSGSSNAVNSTTTTTGALTSQKVELSHLVDPFDGTYKKKLTIPKNYKGNLYLAGLNVAALTSQIIYVRFYFGTDKQAVTLNATVARAPGIVPKTDVQVLVIDMNSRPFSKMTLGYDLYDYNDYTTDPTVALVTDPRDNNIYCRGLKLEDDPTFVPVSQSSTCSSATDKCLYSYAKVADSTLYSYQTVNSSSYLLSSVPTNPQVWTWNSGVRTPSIATFAGTVCLPDDSNVSSVNQLFNLNLSGLTNGLQILTGYYYMGPYRSIDDANWQISSSAIYNSSYGLFQTQSGVVSSTTGYTSFLFPRAGKLALNTSVNYLGSSINKIGARGNMVADSTGTSQYVDGCNFRVMNYDPASNEGIGSCNVDSSIQVFYKDANGNEVTITTDKTIKLQLIRPSLTNSTGKDVLATSFKQCSTSSTCGSNECCFNSRCWSKDLVTQCVDQTTSTGNEQVGSTCTSDFQCESLCCNQSTGACAPHDPGAATPVLCNKAAGQPCVSKEFCAQTAVSTCKIVKTGTVNGVVTCALRCPLVMTYGTCTAGTCMPPAVPAVPTNPNGTPFDGSDCSTAVDP